MPHPDEQMALEYAIMAAWTSASMPTRSSQSAMVKRYVAALKTTRERTGASQAAGSLVADRGLSTESSVVESFQNGEPI